MIIIDKWDELPTIYDIMFPISSRINLNWFYGIIDALYSGSEVDDEIECNGDTDDYIDCGDSTDGGEQIKTAKLVLVNSANYHTYEFEVNPFNANLLYVEFYLELTNTIETGDYQAFLTIDNEPVSTVKFRIKTPKTPYNTYNPDRNITIYER